MLLMLDPADNVTAGRVQLIVAQPVHLLGGLRNDSFVVLLMVAEKRKACK